MSLSILTHFEAKNIIFRKQLEFQTFRNWNFEISCFKCFQLKYEMQHSNNIFTHDTKLSKMKIFRWYKSCLIHKLASLSGNYIFCPSSYVYVNDTTTRTVKYLNSFKSLPFEKIANSRFIYLSHIYHILVKRKIRVYISYQYTK